ncbi:MAG: SCO family protein [candidate division Zixibacteria bacterium]|nr:SCO family protein [candidate division Zixibacteria bacterium]
MIGNSIHGTFRQHTTVGIISAFCLLLVLLAASAAAQVIEDDPAALRGIDVEEHLGEMIPLDLEFIGSDAQPVQLGSFFNREKPVVLILGYYTCPMLCNLVFNGVTDAVKELAWRPGAEFQMVTVSIDPRETDVVAAAKKKNYIEAIGKPGIEHGWEFLTGPEKQSRTLADAVGFKYYYDETQDQYAHPAVVIVLTPSGKISRYLYGIQFTERDLRLALLEASEGKVGSSLDKLILYCFHYDPDAGGYVVFAGNVMRLGGAVTFGLLLVLITALWYRERRKRAVARVGV